MDPGPPRARPTLELHRAAGAFSGIGTFWPQDGHWSRFPSHGSRRFVCFATAAAHGDLTDAGCRFGGRGGRPWKAGGFAAGLAGAGRVGAGLGLGAASGG